MAVTTLEKSGRFLSMPMAEYQDAPGISKSKLDLIHRSPAHFIQEELHPTPPTPAMEWGTMFHTLILEPGVFNQTYAVWDNTINRTTREGKAAWADWQAENEGKISVAKPTMRELEAMREAILTHSRAKEALTGGIAENAMFWSMFDCNCKARPDYIRQRDGLLIDLKTTQDARPDEFSRSCWNYRYHVQAAYYLDGYARVTGEKPNAFLFIAIEKAPPYCVAVYHANEEMIEQGRREYMRDLEVYRRCIETDTWPGYDEEVLSICLPRWAQEVN
jgi:hypothetical protein